MKGWIGLLNYLSEKFFNQKLNEKYKYEICWELLNSVKTILL